MHFQIATGVTVVPLAGFKISTLSRFCRHLIIVLAQDIDDTCPGSSVTVLVCSMTGDVEGAVGHRGVGR
ncbi:hypothetical protein [Frankia sp. Mgl5]|uniref:hypothetical protein n=1 Tax=Frankia sp. Mgl5 TaxID=2933793 RepID=UPI00200C8971|nr:hypothetical protein [Frankia sp. Mgl5]